MIEETIRDISVADLVAAKAGLEAKIFNAILQFQDSTGVDIASLDLEWNMIRKAGYEEDTNEIINVSISLDL